FLDDARVHEDDVGHRHERGDAGHHLRADGGAVLLQAKPPLQQRSVSRCALRGTPHACTLPCEYERSRERSSFFVVYLSLMKRIFLLSFQESIRKKRVFAGTAGHQRPPAILPAGY